MQSAPTTSESVFWSVGFRSFFLSAGVFAALIIPLWLLYLHGFIKTNSYNSWWHGHEMVYGYLAAVLGGFLLTAVQNWTGKPTAHGYLLFYLWALWLLARLLPWLAAVQQHPLIIAAVDVVFLPCLAVAIGTPLVAQKQIRNYGFPIALLCLGVANAVFHWSIAISDDHLTHLSLHMSLLLMLWIMIKLGCRVIPFFTERGLNMAAPLPRAPKHDTVCELAVLLIAPAALLHDYGYVSAFLLVVAAIIIGSRTRQWFAVGVLRTPLLWVLHISFGWLIVALLLMALEVSGLLPYVVSWHVMTIGTMGCLTLGMMARISLGHTGRPLTIAPLTTLAFCLLNVAVITRVLAAYLPNYFLLLLIVSGILWACAFLCFIVVYAPILAEANPAPMSC